MLKFNNGKGAIICDNCRTIIKTPAIKEDVSLLADVCDHCKGYMSFNQLQDLYHKMNPKYKRI
jgi:hypothetical protein